jgi:hypothetical protein
VFVAIFRESLIALSTGNIRIDVCMCGGPEDYSGDVVCGGMGLVAGFNEGTDAMHPVCAKFVKLLKGL